MSLLDKLERAIGRWAIPNITLYLVIGHSFITPRYAVTNMFILGSVFLAFAYLNPDFEMIIFFILPVKIKWLAFIYTAVGAAMFFRGELAERIQIGASITGFVLFF